MKTYEPAYEGYDMPSLPPVEIFVEMPPLIDKKTAQFNRMLSHTMPFGPKEEYDLRVGNNRIHRHVCHEQPQTGSGINMVDS